VDRLKNVSAFSNKNQAECFAHHKTDFRDYKIRFTVNASQDVQRLKNLSLRLTKQLW